MTAEKLKELEAKATEGSALHRTALNSYIRNHCSDFIRLMEAAEEVARDVVGQYDYEDTALKGLEKALAALNKEQS